MQRYICFHFLQLCSCSPSLTPVCNPSTNETYTSGCAAGCNLFNATTNLFSGCSCADAANGLATNLVAGFCPTDCSSSLFYFMLISFLLSLIMTMGKVGMVDILTNSQLKVGNLLVHIRCVDEDDKALGMAIQVTRCTRNGPKTRTQCMGQKLVV